MAVRRRWRKKKESVFTKNPTSNSRVRTTRNIARSPTAFNRYTDYGIVYSFTLVVLTFMQFFHYYCYTCVEHGSRWSWVSFSGKFKFPRIVFDRIKKHLFFILTFVVLLSTDLTFQIFHDGEVSHFLDGFNESNWMAFVRCARHKKEQNLVVFQYHGCIYYRSVKDILPGNELLVWYDNKYTQLLGIPLTWNDNRGKFENIGSVYRSSDIHNIKFIASLVTFVYVWFQENLLSSSGKVEGIVSTIHRYPKDISDKLN